MKGMLKCQHSFFIVFKIFNKLESLEERDHLIDFLNKNVIYISDKTIKQKCMALIQSHQGDPMMLLSAEKSFHSEKSKSSGGPMSH